MFWQKKKVDPDQQIPYQIYESLRENSPRRGRWVIEVLLAASIVVLLSAAGIKLYEAVHKPQVPSPTKSTTGVNVVQSPQQNKNTIPTSPPANTQAGNSTNKTSVSKPSGE